METAVVASGAVRFADGLGEGSNTDAEWLALIAAAELALALGVRAPVFLGDSADVVAQANGARPCRRVGLELHRQRFVALAERFERVRVRLVGRHRNLAGIALDVRRAGRRG